MDTGETMIGLCKSSSIALGLQAFSVTLASPKLLALGNEKKKTFLLPFARFSVTLPTV